MKRPVCAICGNKIDDNTYIWVNSEQRVVHKICRMVTKEYQKNMTINVNPIKMRAKAREIGH
jgi:formylmethanofuran dehydrogenase subunit B